MASYGLAIWLVSAGILTSCSSARAATGSLTWQMAITEASRNNAELRAAQENLQAANSSVQIARATYLPQLSASFSAGLQGNDASNSRAQAEALAQLQGKATESFGASLTASQTIFDGFATQARVNQAQARVRQSELQIQSLKARLSYDLKSAYTGMMQAQRSLRLYLDIIRRRQDNLRLVELRFAGGQENRGAVALSEAYLKQARFEELQARDSLSVTRSRLNKVLGRGDDSSYELKNDIPVSEPPAAPDPLVIARNNPDYKLTMAQEEEASADLALAGAGFYPELGVRGSIGRQDDEFFPRNESWSLSLVLTVPIFSGGRDYYGQKAAANRLTSSGLNRENIERELVTRVRQTQTGFIEAIEKLKVDQSFETALTLRAEIARSKYNNGLSTFDAWDLIENDLINRQRSVLSSQGNRVIAEAAWEQAQGKGSLQ